MRRTQNRSPQSSQRAQRRNQENAGNKRKGRPLEGPAWKIAWNYFALRFLLGGLGLGIDARRDLRERFESLLGLLTVRPVGIEFDRLLICLDGAGLNDDFHL